MPPMILQYFIMPDDEDSTDEIRPDGPTTEIDLSSTTSDGDGEEINKDQDGGVLSGLESSDDNTTEMNTIN